MNSNGLFEVGDRVKKPGLAMKDEPPMFGRVTKVYRSKPTEIHLGVWLVDVEFDGGILKEGFIVDSGALEYVINATFMTGRK